MPENNSTTPSSPAPAPNVSITPPSPESGEAFGSRFQPVTCAVQGLFGAKNQLIKTVKRPTPDILRDYDFLDACFRGLKGASKC